MTSAHETTSKERQALLPIGSTEAAGTPIGNRAEIRHIPRTRVPQDRSGQGPMHPFFL